MTETARFADRVAGALLALAGALPPRLVVGGMALFGRFAFHLLARRRQIAIDQIQAALRLSAAAARDVARCSFVHLGRIAGEWLAQDRFERRGQVRYTCEPHELEALFADRALGKGIVMASGHFGNWEFLAQFLAARGAAATLLSTELLLPAVTRWQHAWRRRHGVRTILRGKRRTAGSLAGCFRRGASIGYLIDQDTSARSSVIPFFGRPARAPIGPARLALRAGAPFWLGYAQRTGWFTYHIHLEKIAFEPSVDIEADAHLLTVRASARVESWIAGQPGQCLWMLDRYKRMQPGTPAAPSDPGPQRR